MKNTVFTVIAVLLLICATAQFAAGDYTVRNYGDSDVFVSYAYWDTSYGVRGMDGAWFAQGWYKVEPGKKRNLSVPSNQANVYLRIERKGQEVLPAGHENKDAGFFHHHPHEAHDIYQYQPEQENLILEGSSPTDGLEMERYWKYPNGSSFTFGDPPDKVLIDGLSLNYGVTYNGKHLPNDGGNAFILLEQFGNTCGPTSLEMVLHYYGVAATMGDVWRAGGIHSVWTGTWPDEMRQALNGLGVPSDWYELGGGKFRSLRQYVDQDRPPCILFKIVERSDVNYHWVVVVGYNSKSNEYLIADPAGVFEWIERGELDKLWGFHGVPKTRGRWSGPITKGWWKEWGTDFVAKPYTVIVPQSASPREHFTGLWSEMQAVRMTGTGRFGGSTRGWEKTLKFDKAFDSYRVTAIEELSSRGTAKLSGHKKVGEKSVKLWGRIEDGLVLRGKMWVMVRTYRYRE